MALSINFKPIFLVPEYTLDLIVLVLFKFSTSLSAWFSQYQLMCSGLYKLVRYQWCYVWPRNYFDRYYFFQLGIQQWEHLTSKQIIKGIGYSLLFLLLMLLSLLWEDYWISGLTSNSKSGKIIASWDTYNMKTLKPDQIILLAKKHVWFHYISWVVELFEFRLKLEFSRQRPTRLDYKKNAGQVHPLEFNLRPA